MSEVYKNYLKPFLDLLLAISIVILFSCLILLILLLYILSLEFPIFFKQQRLGKNEKPFAMWKFRTLRSDETLQVHQRKFQLGNFMRITNLDELPQIWNILKGEMSWIGPRALPVEYETLFSIEQRIRFDVKPGITGWAQVNGRHSIGWKEKLELDQFYVNNLSGSLDMKIFFKTIVLLLAFKKDVSLEEQPFKGN